MTDYAKMNWMAEVHRTAVEEARMHDERMQQNRLWDAYDRGYEDGFRAAERPNNF